MTKTDYLYVCGPPCSGKSTLVQILRKKHGFTAYINGDSHWITFQKLSFNERVQKTNQLILEDISTLKPDTAIIEWVPWNGPFVVSLFDIAKSIGRTVYQVILTAEESLLHSRKQARDGNADLGCLPPVIDFNIGSRNVSCFDTGRLSAKNIGEMLYNYLPKP
jgi:hypothetical protein